MKQPPRTLFLLAAVLALFLVPAPGLRPSPGEPGAPVRQGTPALAAAIEEAEVGLAGSFPTFSVRRAADGPAETPAALLMLPVLLAVAALFLVPRGPAARPLALAPLRGPPTH